MSKQLTHLDSKGRAQMVNVGAKPVTAREAIAEGFIHMQRSTLQAIADEKIAKGEVLNTARIAGIFAAKRCGELIPLCHPLPIESVEVLFDLQLDFKIPPQGNSGVIYRCDETYGVSWGTGVECQIIDNAWKAGLEPGQKCGAAYEICPPFQDTAKPVGQWNHLRILANGPHVEHWLNGVKVAEYEQGSDQFKDIVAHAKFKQFPKFGTLMKGHIALQDHGANVQFRNIKIKEIQ
jgi:hypothetical protein